MKNLILGFAFLFSAHVWADPVSPSMTSLASMLGQVADHQLAGQEGTQLIRSILMTQSYDVRFSVINTRCDSVKGITSCLFVMGSDNIQDEDHGWSTIYDLKIESNEKGVVTKATLEFSAG
jgi:hypothetical protein